MSCHVATNAKVLGPVMSYLVATNAKVLEPKDKDKCLTSRDKLAPTPTIRLVLLLTALALVDVCSVFDSRDQQLSQNLIRRVDISSARRRGGRPNYDQTDVND